MIFPEGSGHLGSSMIDQNGRFNQERDWLKRIKEKQELKERDLQRRSCVLACVWMDKEALPGTKNRHEKK